MIGSSGNRNDIVETHRCIGHNDRPHGSPQCASGLDVTSFIVLAGKQLVGNKDQQQSAEQQ
ncbi:hypothetical protein D3C80_1936070 [compost metagenome]